MEDDLQGKKTFDGRWPSIEGNLWWKTTFNGRPLLWQTTFNGRHHSMEDTFNGRHLQWKMAFDGRWLSMEDNLWWKATFDERQHSTLYLWLNNSNNNPYCNLSMSMQANERLQLGYWTRNFQNRSLKLKTTSYLYRPCRKYRKQKVKKK